MTTGVAMRTLIVKLAAGRVWVTPFVRINEHGNREYVDGYWRKVPLGWGGGDLIHMMPDGYPDTHPARRFPITYFDSKVCMRCGGTGFVENGNALDGNICYGCGGNARILTKEGARGYEAYVAARRAAQTHPASEVKVGDTVLLPTGMTSESWIRVTDLQKRDDGRILVRYTPRARGLLAPEETQTVFEPDRQVRIRNSDYSGVPDKSTFPGYVGFKPEGWNVGGKIQDDGMPPTGPDPNRPSSFSDRVEEGVTYAVLRRGGGGTRTMASFNNERDAQRERLRLQRESDQDPDAGIRGTAGRFSVARREPPRQPVYKEPEPPKDMTNDEAQSFVAGLVRAGQRRFDVSTDIGEFQVEVLNTDDEGMSIRNLDGGKEGRIPWSVVNQAVVSARQETAIERLQKKLGQVASPEANFPPSLIELLLKGKLIDADISPQMIQAALQALQLYGSEADSDFIQSVIDSAARKGTLSPAQARGVLNFFRRRITKGAKKK